MEGPMAHPTGGKGARTHHRKTQRCHGPTENLHIQRKKQITKEKPPTAASEVR